MPRGGAFAGSKIKDMTAGAKTDADNPPDKKESAQLGSAHKIWGTYTQLKVEEAALPTTPGGKQKSAVKVGGGKTSLSKREVKDLVCELQRLQHIQFVSMAKLEAFVDDQFTEFDADGNNRMDFNEFYAFYRKWLNVDSDAVLGQLTRTMDEVERCFLEADTDGNMSLDKDEIVNLLKKRAPPGEPPLEDDELKQLVDELLAEFDANGDGAFQYDEFAEAFNTMIERLAALHAAAYDQRMQLKGFKTVVPDDELDDDDIEALEAAVRRRYEGETWIVREGEFMPRAGGGPAGASGKSAGDLLASGKRTHHAADAAKLAVPVQAAKARRIPLLLKHPDQVMCNISQRLSGRADALLVDVEGLVKDTGREEKPLTDREFAAAVRDAIVSCWIDGKMCALRLGQTAPDFGIKFNMPDVLPFPACWDPTNHIGGSALAADLHCMLTASPAAKGISPETFSIHPDFQLAIISSFSMHTWRNNLRGKIPVHFLQPVQVCSSLSQIAFVLRDPRRACPEEDVESALAKMDRLAAMLDDM